MNLREIPAVCGQTCLPFSGGSGQLGHHVYLITDDSIVMQYHALCTYHYEEAIIVCSANLLDSFESKTLQFN